MLPIYIKEKKNNKIKPHLKNFNFINPSSHKNLLYLPKIYIILSNSKQLRVLPFDTCIRDTRLVAVL